ncbi:hypothetical protein DXB10_26740 [Escherichia coli]|nr:hypothetical protein [Escherichia coli]KQI92962.1 hypothetical protein AM262_25190 [Escherichia coli]RGO29272.1 hypothetical protein DXB20_26260 [Escherichia coli]RGO37896.1 hypothetical protein DXB13_26250 [Escherichia coli]RGO56586.1 hypothetical protein DXB10_26740 [Escherichia coli]
MLPSETMIWQPEFTDKTLSRKPGAVHKLTAVCSHDASIGNVGAHLSKTEKITSRCNYAPAQSQHQLYHPVAQSESR